MAIDEEPNRVKISGWGIDEVDGSGVGTIIGPEGGKTGVSCGKTSRIDGKIRVTTKKKNLSRSNDFCDIWSM